MRRGDWSRLHADDGARKAALRPWSNVLAVGHRRRAGAPPKTTRLSCLTAATRSTSVPPVLARRRAVAGTGRGGEPRSCSTRPTRRGEERAPRPPPVPPRQCGLPGRRCGRHVLLGPDLCPGDPAAMPERRRAHDTAADVTPAHARLCEAPRLGAGSARSLLAVSLPGRCRSCATARKRGGSAPHTDDRASLVGCIAWRLRRNARLRATSTQRASACTARPRPRRPAQTASPGLTAPWPRSSVQVGARCLSLARLLRHPLAHIHTFTLRPGSPGC